MDVKIINKGPIQKICRDKHVTVYYKPIKFGVQTVRVFYKQEKTKKGEMRNGI